MFLDTKNLSGCPLSKRCDSIRKNKGAQYLFALLLWYIHVVLYKHIQYVINHTQDGMSGQILIWVHHVGHLLFGELKACLFLAAF
jgi:hypothetical protein